VAAISARIPSVIIHLVTEDLPHQTCNCLSHTPATPTYDSHIATLVLKRRYILFSGFYERKWRHFPLLRHMNMPRLEDKEILSKERDSPHERTTRQVRTDIGESDQHLSYTNKESLCLRSWQAAFQICGLTGQNSPLSGLPLDLCLA
jgi:hypothetical protein